MQDRQSAYFLPLTKPPKQNSSLTLEFHSPRSAKSLSNILNLSSHRGSVADPKTPFSSDKRKSTETPLTSNKSFSSARKPEGRQTTIISSYGMRTTNSSNLSPTSIFSPSGPNLLRERRSEELTQTFKLLDHIIYLREKATKLSNAEEKTLPGLAEIRKSFKALEILSEEDSRNMDILKSITTILNSCIYFSDTVPKKYATVWNSLRLEELKELTNKIGSQKLPYFMVCQMLLKEIKKRDAEHALIVEDKENQIQRLLMEVNELKVSLQTNVNEKINNEVTKIKAGVQSERKSLLENITNLREELVNLNNKYETALQDLEESRAKYESETKLLKKANMTIRELKEELVLKAEAVKIANTKVNSFQHQAQTFKDVLDKVLVQLSSIKKMATALRQEKEELEHERDSLKMRAAVGWEELTPRPNYRKLQDENKMDFQVRTAGMKKGKNNLPVMSTQQVFEALLGKYREVVNQKAELMHQKAELESELRAAQLANACDSPRLVLSKRGSAADLKPKSRNQSFSRPSPLQSVPGSPSRRNSKNLVINLLPPSEDNSARYSSKNKSIFAKTPKKADRSPLFDSEASFDIKEIGQPLTVSGSNSVMFSRMNSKENYGELSPEENKQGSESEILGESHLQMNLAEAIGLERKPEPLSDDILKSSDDLIREITETKLMIKQIETKDACE